MHSIIISGDRYTVTPLDCHPEVARVAFRVEKASGMYYVAYQDDRGYLSCDCADCVFRQRACKHVSALVTAGLLPSEADVELADAA